MNVGNLYDTLGTSQQRVLIHETSHVWQGKNSTFALTYVFNSVLNQCLHGNGAYSHTPGQPWKSCNAEQQVQIIELGQKMVVKNRRLPQPPELGRRGRWAEALPACLRACPCS
jgi:hypothetical protein